VEGRISDVGDRGMPDSNRNGRESLRPRRLDILWIWKVFGPVITVGS
jgi:hypothetical protein